MKHIKVSMPLDMPISFLILGCFRAFMRFQGYNCTLLIIKNITHNKAYVLGAQESLRLFKTSA